MSRDAGSTEVQVTFGTDDLRAEKEAFQREYRGDILVTFADGRRFELAAFTPRRIAQQLEDGTEPYFAEPAIIVLLEITSENILRTVQDLAAKGFFDQLLPAKS